MKKILSISTLVIALAFFANTDALAQQGQFKAGVGLAFATQDVGIGGQAGVTYGFTDEIAGAANFTYYFPDGFDWWEINANGHYNFLNEDGTAVYGLAGLNYASLSFPGVQTQFGSFGGGSTSEIGLNLGAGAEFDADFALIFAELKYVIGNADKLDIAAGLRFPF